MLMDEQFVTVDYKSNGTDYKYNIQLEALTSNSGKGDVWYFICPFTLQQFRKLHLIQGRFMHHSAFKSGMNATQTETKSWRKVSRVYGGYFALEKYYNQLHAKHFKTHYKGKPTKRYLKLMQKISQAEKIPLEDIERLMILGTDNNSIFEL